MRRILQILPPIFLLFVWYLLSVLDLYDVEFTIQLLSKLILSIVALVLVMQETLKYKK